VRDREERNDGRAGDGSGHGADESRRAGIRRTVVILVIFVVAVFAWTIYKETG
jgi:hypothetical protein